MNKNFPITSFFYGLSFIMFLMCPHLFSLWICLELNTMMMVSFMMKEKVEAAVTYFLTQSISSMMMILIIVSTDKENINNSLLISVSVFYIVLFYKMGAAPFLGWFISLASSLSTMIFFLLLTMQKIMPFLLFQLSNSMSWEILTIVMMTLVAGSMMNFSSNNMKMLLTFSSITHVGWFLIAISISLMVWMMYFMVYLLILLWMLKIMKLNLSSQYLSKTQNKIMMMYLMMTMAGLPPLVIFIPKLLILTYMMNYEMWSIISVLILSSMMDFFVYLRAGYSISIMSSASMMWMDTKPSPYVYIIFKMFLMVTLTWLTVTLL